MIGVEAFAAELLFKGRLRMAVDFNHDGIGLTVVVYAPVSAVRNAAFHQWLYH